MPIPQRYPNSLSFRQLCRVLLTVALLATPLTAQSTGGLDPNFGTGGKVLMSWNVANHPIDEVLAVASQFDGKIVLAGRSFSWSTATSNCTIARTLSDGSLDTSFGNQGFVLLSFDVSPADDGGYCGALAIQGDGKILVGGSSQTSSDTEPNFAVARLTASGALDSTFGNGGRATFDFISGPASYEYVVEILLQSDGKIVLAGTVHWPHGSTDYDFVAIRLEANGSLDTSYGTGGYQLVPFDLVGAGADLCHDAVLQADGKLVMVGRVDTSDDRAFAAARLDSSGHLDSSFGISGKATVVFHPGQHTRDQGLGITLDGSQRLILVGETTPPGATEPRFAIARLTSQGTLDTSFSIDGKTTITFPYPHGSWAEEVAPAANNKLIVAGSALYTPDDADLAVVRLLDDGSVDTSFGSSGRTIIPFDIGPDRKSDHLTAMTLQLDGGIVMTGMVDSGTQSSPDRLWGIVKLVGEPFFSLP